MASGTDRYVAFAFLVGIASCSRLASAQTASAAQVFFDEGRRLMEAGDYPAACAKLAESERLDPAGGTLMNLAACHVREGRTAAAWAEFTDALAQARRDGRQDRVLEATHQLAELAPHLARLSLIVDDSVPNLEVLLDGTALGPASWGSSFPVDPGEHEIRAHAPGRVTWATRVSIAAGVATPIRVPSLPLTPSTEPAPPVPAPARGSRVPGIIVGGLGLASLGVGATFGVLAANRKHESEATCNPQGTACTTGGASLLREANTDAWVSDVGFGVGAAALLVSTYLLFIGPRRAEPARATVLLMPGPGSLAVGAGGVW